MRDAGYIVGQEEKVSGEIDQKEAAGQNKQDNLFKIVYMRFQSFKCMLKRKKEWMTHLHLWHKQKNVFFTQSSYS